MPSRPGYHRPHLLFHHLSSPPRDPGLGSWFCSNTPGSYSFPDSHSTPPHPSWSQDRNLAILHGSLSWRLHSCPRMWLWLRPEVFAPGGEGSVQLTMLQFVNFFLSCLAHCHTSVLLKEPSSVGTVTKDLQELPR